VSEELVRTDQGTPVQASPSEIIANASEMAKAMMDIVEAKRLYQPIAGRKFLQCEAWQLLASFSGLTPVVTETKFVEFGDVKGWEARCEVRDRNGQIVAAGEAMCLDDERNWRGKPLYQLRSMAQTRAVSKALRTKLSFIAVLAGYEPTPAEEMDGVELKPEISQAQAKPKTEPKPEEKEGGEFNEFAAYDKCIEDFGKEIVDDILKHQFDGVLPRSREAWRGIWFECRKVAIERKKGGSSNDRQRGVSLYPGNPGD